VKSFLKIPKQIGPSMLVIEKLLKGFKFVTYIARRLIGKAIYCTIITGPIITE